ncbi:MAG TPA: hypothetical protein VMM14_07275 [Acidimicrobiia bacterium]|nr:hypothetical protein [Acidimicrobiia bacterium]
MDRMRKLGVLVTAVALARGSVNMRIRLIAFLTGVMLVLVMAAPAMAAPGAKHGSCEGFGQAFAAWARGELPAEAGHPGTVMPVLAQTSPGFAAEILHAEMTTEVPGIPGTPFCEAHPTK